MKHPAARQPVALFVDDDRTMHDAYAELFRLAGLSPVCVTSGRVALAAAKRWHPSVIVVHLWGGDPHAFRTAWAIKQDEATTAIPLIGFTAPGTASRARMAGCDFVLQKPATPAQFVAIARGAVADARNGPARSGRTDGMPPSS